MAKKDEEKNPQPAAKRGGLGRGLGALIPSAPLGNGGAGKGHFWSALDNPPPIDPATAAGLASSVSLPSVSRETSSDGADPADEPAGDAQTPAVAPNVAESSDSTTESDASSRAADEAPEETGDVSRETVGIAGIDSVDPEVADEVSPDVSRETGTSEPDAADLPDTAVEASTASSDSRDAAVGGDRDETEAVKTADAAVLVELDPGEIVANPKNPRQVFDEDDLVELSESVREFGLLQPIVVRRRDDGAFELVMGERRLRASRMAGLTTIPVIVRQTDDDAMLRDALLENIHRVQLHPLEEAAAYQQLIDEFGVTHDELAQRIKRSRPVISNTIRLMKLPTRVQNRVAAGVISGSHARALLSLESAEQQEALATRIVAEGLSVRATEEAVTMANGDGGQRRTSRKRNFTAPALSGLADKLSDHFDTRATVQLGRTKGKIVVEFASVDDLERIVAMMAPHLATDRLREQVADEPRED